jgi:hypothetical protein
MSCWPGRARRPSPRFLAELVTYQAATRLRGRIEWAVPALRIPKQVAWDTGIVFAALYRRLARGEEPASGFRERPVRYCSPPWWD